jgi:hypothetical protein
MSGPKQITVEPSNLDVALESAWRRGFLAGMDAGRAAASRGEDDLEGLREWVVEASRRSAIQAEMDRNRPEGEVQSATPRNETAENES